MPAVITADIVNSTLLDNATEKRLIAAMGKMLAPFPYEFFRGDSLQVYIKDAIQSFRVIILLRVLARKTELNDNRFDLRASIGIGDVKPTFKDFRSAKGEAFILAGRAYDSDILSKRRDLTILCGREPFDTAFEILADHVDDIIQRMTPKQAGIIYELVSGHTQFEIANKLKKAQPTISKMANAANWNQLQGLLNKFERLIKQLS